jgi:hypothetical protein
MICYNCPQYSYYCWYRFCSPPTLRWVKKQTNKKHHDFRLSPGMNTDFWFWGFCTMCKIDFLTTFRDPQRLPKRQEMYLTHRAKSPEPKISKQISCLYNFVQRAVQGVSFLYAWIFFRCQLRFQKVPESDLRPLVKCCGFCSGSTGLIKRLDMGTTFVIACLLYSHWLS